MADLKLVALDDEDLTVISATMQDAVFKVEDMDFDHASGQFLLAANRFVWENIKSKRTKTHERHRSNIVFKRVRNIKLRGIDRSKNDEVLSLLAIQFHKNEDGPDGQIELVMSANAGVSAGILLDVECIEVQLTDTGGAWETKFKPSHGS